MIALLGRDGTASPEDAAMPAQLALPGDRFLLETVLIIS
jgi:hypothetical protein